MAIRDYLLRNGFAHRRNKDGTTDSTCLFCYASVASHTNESALSGAEAIHNCWQPDELTRNQSMHRPNVAWNRENSRVTAYLWRVCGFSGFGRVESQNSEK
jgi:hypothetical protein